MASTPSVTSEVTNCFCCMFIGRFSFTMVNNRYETTVHLERVFPSFFAAICSFTIFTGVTGLSLINRNT
jgi:Na+/pantothenate symporter